MTGAKAHYSTRLDAGLKARSPTWALFHLENRVFKRHTSPNDSRTTTKALSLDSPQMRRLTRDDSFLELERRSELRLYNRIK